MIFKDLFTNYESQRVNLNKTIKKLKTYIKYELSSLTDDISPELSSMIIETVNGKLNLIEEYYKMIEDIDGKLIQLDMGVDIGEM